MVAKLLLAEELNLIAAPVNPETIVGSDAAEGEQVHLRLVIPDDPYPALWEAMAGVVVGTVVTGIGAKAEGDTTVGVCPVAELRIGSDDLEGGG